MSWFEYGEPQRRSLRKGVYLRVRELDKDLITAAGKFMRATDGFVYVVIKEIQPNGHVLLEFWCQDVCDTLAHLPRYNVFHISTKENPAWICEGDLGRGYKEPKVK